MKRSEHKAIIDKVLGMIAPEHQAAASEALNTLSTDYGTTLDSLETANTSVQELTTANESLRAVNTKLFLQVGASEKKEQEEETKEEENKPLPFDDLFNEKGELK